MAEIRKALLLDKIDYYKVHLSVINCFLPSQVRMTSMETTILACFMVLEGDIAQYRFGPSAKKVVMAALDLSPAGMSNYIKSLTDKGLIIRTGDVLSILPILEPDEKEQLYSFKLKVKVYEPTEA